MASELSNSCQNNVINCIKNKNLYIGIVFESGEMSDLLSSTKATKQLNFFALFELFQTTLFEIMLQDQNCAAATRNERRCFTDGQRSMTKDISKVHWLHKMRKRNLQH